MGKAHDDERTFIAHLGFFDSEDDTCLPTGGITVAYRANLQGGLDIGIAECSIRDRHNKVLGSKIATGRLTKKPLNAMVNQSFIGSYRLGPVLQPIVANEKLSACLSVAKKSGKPLKITYRRGGYTLMTVLPTGEIIVNCTEVYPS